MAEKRAYLRGERRRRQLLDATADLIASDGLPAVTMVAVAERAGVSRRLVYDHFADLPTLFEAFTHDRVERYLQMFDARFETAEGDWDASIRAALATLLEIPGLDLRILRVLTLDGGTATLAAAGDHIRSRLTERWMPFVAGHIDPEVARAVVWATFNGLLGLADLVDRGELSVERALAFGTRFATVTTHSVIGIPEFAAEA